MREFCKSVCEGIPRLYNYISILTCFLNSLEERPPTNARTPPSGHWRTAARAPESHPRPAGNHRQAHAATPRGRRGASSSSPEPGLGRPPLARYSHARARLSSAGPPVRDQAHARHRRVLPVPLRHPLHGGRDRPAPPPAPVPQAAAQPQQPRPNRAARRWHNHPDRSTAISPEPSPGARGPENRAVAARRRRAGRRSRTAPRTGTSSTASARCSRHSPPPPPPPPRRGPLRRGVNRLTSGLRGVPPAGLLRFSTANRESAQPRRRGGTCTAVSRMEVTGG